MNRIKLYLSLFLFLFVSHVQAESIVPDGVEHIDAYSVVMDIKQDSSIDVLETIDYDYADKTKSVIIRDIPLNYQDLKGDNISVGISNLFVVDENNNQYKFKQAQIFSVDKKKTYLEVTIGDENQPVSGTKKYIIHYTLTGAIKFLADHNELFWNVIGDKWPVYIKYPEVKINLPQKVEKNKITKECFIGIHEATMACIDRIESAKNSNINYSYKGVVAGEGMTVIYTFPKGIVQEPKNQLIGGVSKSISQKKLFSILIVLFVLIIFVASFRISALSSLRKKSIQYFFVQCEKIKKIHISLIALKTKKWWIGFCVVSIIFVFIGGVVFWKVGTVLNRISVKGENIASIAQASVGGQEKIKGESDDRINILLLGILGANHPGGGLNTDTIMVASIEPKANKLSLISIPRDLWVTDPGKETKSKINSVYAYGEEKGFGQGIVDMETLVSDITGIPISYTAVINTAAFTQLVDTLGGVEINLSKAFDESAQFEDIQVCDGSVYTIPTGKFQYKKNSKKKIVATYPLCKNKEPECGGSFHLPAGKNNLSGTQAICFVRSRYLTSDFERAKRQQLIIQQVKQKFTQLGIGDFEKINAILDNLGANVRTNMQFLEMTRLFALYKGMDNPKIYQRVLEDSKEGLLYAPDSKPETGYILLPRGDNYDKIRDAFQNIFNIKTQSDIKPTI